MKVVVCGKSRPPSRKKKPRASATRVRQGRLSFFSLLRNLPLLQASLELSRRSSVTALGNVPPSFAKLSPVRAQGLMRFLSACLRYAADIGSAAPRTQHVGRKAA
eukprot:1218677-Rhodomonas_salina.2